MVTQRETLVWETWTHGIGSKVHGELGGSILRFFYKRKHKTGENEKHRKRKKRNNRGYYGHQKRRNDSLTQINREESFTPVSSHIQPKLVPEKNDKPKER